MIQLPQVQAVMSTILDRSSDTVADSDYRVVGTAAALLHGVHLPAADVDVLLRERAGVHAFTAALSQQECLSPPQYLDCSKQYFASFRVQGITVEFSTVEADSKSATNECVGNGPWSHFSMVRCGCWYTPVVALELRLLTELARGRADRYIPIWQFLQSRGYDTALLGRGLRDRGITRSEHVDLTPLTGSDSDPSVA